MPNSIRLDERRLPIRISKPGREPGCTWQETADPLRFSHPEDLRTVKQARDQSKANTTVVAPSFVHANLGHPFESRFGLLETIAAIWALPLIVQCQAVHRRFGRTLEGRLLKVLVTGKTNIATGSPEPYDSNRYVLYRERG